MSENENETTLEILRTLAQEGKQSVQSHAPRAAQADSDAGQHAPDEAQDRYDWDENPLANASISTQASISGADNEGVPDFTFIHLCSTAMEVPGQSASKAVKSFFRRRAGFSTAHQCFPGFIELKSSPSRQTKNRFQEQSNKFQWELKQKLAAAIRQLVRYCNIYTMRQSKPHPKDLPILLIAGSGAWWSYCLADLQEIPMWDFDTYGVLEEDLPRFNTLRRSFSHLYELCTADSDDMLNRLYHTHLVLFEDHSNPFPIPMGDDGDDLDEDVEDLDEDVEGLDEDVEDLDEDVEHSDEDVDEDDDIDPLDTLTMS